MFLGLQNGVYTQLFCLLWSVVRCTAPHPCLTRPVNSHSFGHHLMGEFLHLMVKLLANRFILISKPHSRSQLYKPSATVLYFVKWCCNTIVWKKYHEFCKMNIFLENSETQLNCIFSILSINMALEIQCKVKPIMQNLRWRLASLHNSIPNWTTILKG